VKWRAAACSRRGLDRGSCVCDTVALCCCCKRSETAIDYHSDGRVGGGRGCGTRVCVYLPAKDISYSDQLMEGIIPRRLRRGPGGDAPEQGGSGSGKPLPGFNKVFIQNGCEVPISFAVMWPYAGLGVTGAAGWTGWQWVEAVVDGGW